ncbi:MAG: glutamine amidotransferase [Acidobacteria bacterium]|nr:glutamine amidotransferase [Acidobacteriota bacterium]MCI0717963.1 glutamine amidotransferase [Acidobacteriota bacterium]
MDAVFQFFFKYKWFLFEKGKLSFESAFPGWMLLALAAACGGGALFLYRSHLNAAKEASFSWRRLPLPLLRTSILLCLLVALLRPSLHVATLLPRENIAALLLDDSSSMTIQDAGGRSRLDALKQFLDPNQGSFLADVEKKFRTRTFRFSRHAQKLDSPQALQADGTGTSLESALDDVLKELDAAPLASIVLFTDGADNRSKNLLAVLNKLQSRKIAVHVCALGHPEIEKDIELIQASAPQTVLPESITTAVASLRSNGYAGRNVVLEVREGGKLVQSKPVALIRNNDIQTVELNLASKGKGLKSYTVSVAVQPGEPIQRNNAQTVLLNIEDSRPKILYLEGAPRWEFKFIRAAIEPDKNLQLMTLLRTSGNKFYRQGVESEDNLAAGFPATKEDLFQYKGLILGSIEASFFSADQLKMISDFASERGGGFIMLGGKNSFDAGKYAATPVADVLPVVLGQTQASASFMLEPVKFRLTPHGRSHLATRLAIDESANEKRWNALPQLEDYNLISSAKPGATVLALGSDSRRNLVLLATHRYGRGRAAALMTSNSWAWQMEMPHEDDSHEVFWRQTLRWLAGSAPDQVDLTLDRNAIPEGEVVTLAAEVNDPAFTKLNDAQVTAAITPPSGKAAELPLHWSVKKDGLYQGDFRPGEQGTYRVVVTAVRQGKEVGKSERFFTVTDSNLEFFSAGQNRELLQRIASETGGRYYTLANARQLPEDMTYVERPNSVPQILPLWDMPILFILLCSLLSAEWAWRKREELA